MAKISLKLLDGGSGLDPDASIADLREVLSGIVTDMAALRTKLNATLTKLDADTGVNGTNYSSLNAVGTLVTTVES